jgi:ell wall binding domain 2 (CWB2)
VATTLWNLGYHDQIRLAGGDEYATAVAIDQAITAKPTKVIVATGTQYYDALAAGAAAGANPGTVVVLTDGAGVPAGSASYLNSITPTDAYGAGGPGDTALANALADRQLTWGGTVRIHHEVGGTAPDTALLLANIFFTRPATAAVATSRGWYDALTGGAAAGLNDAPLLLTSPSGLYGPDATYLSTQTNMGLLSTALVLGGPEALPVSVLDQVQNVIRNGWQLPGGATVPGMYEEPIITERARRAL